MRAHRVGGVGDNIQHNLLKPPLVRGEQRKLRSQFKLNRDSCPLQIAAHQGNGFSDEFADIERS
jgi:hypothetical protein